MKTLSEIRKSLPAELAAAVDGYDWRRNRIGMSAAGVFRLTAKDKHPLYLKIAPRAFDSALSGEKRRLDWLRNRLPVPEALFYAENEAHCYLLMTEIAGAPAIGEARPTNVSNVVRRLVEGLLTIHAVPVEECPFRVPVADKIAAAKRRMLAGLVDEEDFDDERRGRSAEEVFRELLESVPRREEDPVFTHGDYCVPNVILDDGRLSGFVDWAGAGVADRYQDLALLSRSVAGNFGPQWETFVFELYGLAPDREKIRFYRLLDEFF